MDVFGHAGDFDVADVEAVEEAREVDEHYDGDEDGVELEEEGSFGFGVEDFFRLSAGAGGCWLVGHVVGEEGLMLAFRVRVLLLRERG